MSVTFTPSLSLLDTEEPTLNICSLAPFTESAMTWAKRKFPSSETQQFSDFDIQTLNMLVPLLTSRAPLKVEAGLNFVCHQVHLL